MHALWIDGEPATAEDLAHQALFPYGAFTSFRVENGGVRGLGRHLARLDASAVELFGEAVPEARLRELMQRALAGRRDAWLRVSLFSRDIWMRQADPVGAPSVMVGVFDPPPPLAASVTLHPQVHERAAAHLKHAGTFDLMRARRLAKQAGFDDALFADAEGRVSEGSVWNIGFFVGDRIVWPEAPMLAGVAQALIEANLGAVGLESERRRVDLNDLDSFDGAFICNSATPACAVTAIGEQAFAPAPHRIARVAEAWGRAPLEPL